MDFALSARSEELRAKLVEFDTDVVRPAETEYRRQRIDSGDIRYAPPIMEDLKVEASKRDLWNLFLPDDEYGPGLSNTDYAPLCEVMGQSPLLGEATNCSAPDTGNMEILAQFGTDEQKEQWLHPLLDGEIRSCFAMTEPWVASSDASNICSRIERDGDHYVINGHKWFTSGGLDPRCKVAVFMGVTDPDADPYHRQSMILVPMDAPGVQVRRGLTVFSHDEGPGHAETFWDNVRVPVDQPARRGGRRLRDRAGASRARSHPPLHARDRARREGARVDVRARAAARRVRSQPRRPGRHP